MTVVKPDTETVVSCRQCSKSALRAWTHSIMSSVVDPTTIPVQSRAARRSVLIDVRLD